MDIGTLAKGASAMNCKILTREMLHLPVDVFVDDPAPDFYGAKKAADARARQLTEEPMLRAWFDRISGEFSPKGEPSNATAFGCLLYSSSFSWHLSQCVTHSLSSCSLIISSTFFRLSKTSFAFWSLSGSLRPSARVTLSRSAFAFFSCSIAS